MANVRNSNTFSVDAASTDASDSIEGTSLHLMGILFTPNSAGQTMKLNDLAPGPAAGDDKLTISGDIADRTRYYDLARANIVFPNGLWVTSISAGAKATLVISGGAA